MTLENRNQMIHNIFQISPHLKSQEIHLFLR